MSTTHLTEAKMARMPPEKSDSSEGSDSQEEVKESTLEERAEAYRNLSKLSFMSGHS